MKMFVSRLPPQAVLVQRLWISTWCFYFKYLNFYGVYILLKWLCMCTYLFFKIVHRISEDTRLVHGSSNTKVIKILRI